MKILHITPHVGGGIGSAYVGLGDCGMEQSVLLLEPPSDQNAVDKVRTAGFHILRDIGLDALKDELLRADIVLFDWFHHPALVKFLRNMPDVPIRSILWCHVSGNYFPHISEHLVRVFDQTLFATPYSLQLPQIRALGDIFLQEHCGVVYGLNDLRRFAEVQRVPHDGYTIGYIGTMEFCKLHPDFVDFCAAAGFSDSRFLMVGTPTTRDTLLKAAAEKGLAHRFEFPGRLTDVAEALARMDIFSYLLNPQHFGATENALLEAMAAGLPTVALEQCVERQIIRHGKTGILVRTPREYGEAVRFLREHPDDAWQMGQAAREDILDRYAIQTNRQRFLAACQRVVMREKHPHSFAALYPGEPADWFLSGVDKDRKCFLENRPQDAGQIFREKNKGSPAHFSRVFPEDERLSHWAGQLTEGV